MSLTEFPIERKGFGRAVFCFGVLVTVYFLTSLGVASLLRFPLFGAGVLGLFAIAFVFAGWQFLHFGRNAVRRLRLLTGVVELDKDDRFHQRLANIVEELCAAAGEKRPLECAVLPSCASNAFVAEDLGLKPLVVISEGMLSHLSRPELLAVVAKLVAEIRTGIALNRTLACGLFAFSQKRFLHWASRGLQLFAPRCLHLQSDALGAELCRDPMSLASALYEIAHRWRGETRFGAGCEALFVMDPAVRSLEEKNSLWAELRASHPPLKKRLDALLKRVRLELDARCPKAQAVTWFVHDANGVWQGPLDLAGFSRLDGVLAGSWVASCNTLQVKRLGEDVTLAQAWRAKEGGGTSSLEKSTLESPVFRQPMLQTSYEKAPFYFCPFSEGCLVAESKLVSVVRRYQKAATSRSARMAAFAQQAGPAPGVKLRQGGYEGFSWPRCPVSCRKLERRFYKSGLAVEVDASPKQGLLWIGREEMTLLGCVFRERRSL
ncbi:MAG: M48 family metalloprotease [Candidatus Omnitrophica bacterium]|nr:M48 family metalloprotease [Candidatus Omnitrophota bacterium]